jgi:hypothetical protein
MTSHVLPERCHLLGGRAALRRADGGTPEARALRKGDFSFRSWPLMYDRDCETIPNTVLM